MDWKPLIAKMMLIKNKIREEKGGDFYPYHLPNAAATDSEIDHISQTVGREIPPDYLDFLRTANGWKGFLLDTDLLGTEELNDPRYLQAANDCFFSLDETQIEGFQKKDLLAVSVNLSDRDVFLMVIAEGNHFGEVVWFAGEEIDRYESFPEFFASMILYNERSLKKLRGEPV